MLEELMVRDYAIIDKLTVHFQRGLNLLTGETGAGKSILIGALGFLLGAKAETGIIRSGAEETLVSGIFAVEGNDEALAWLKLHEIDCEDGTVLVRRTLKKNGRGAIYIQNVPAVRQDLVDFTANLVEVHGQREGLSLLKADKQRSLLDRYAGIESDVRAYSLVYQELCARRKAYDRLSTAGEATEREIELLKFAIDEIGLAALKPGEDAALLDEEKKLSQFEKLFASVASLKELLSDPDGILAKLRKARTHLDYIQSLDSKLAPASAGIEGAYFELEDSAQSIRDYLEQLSCEPGRLEEIENRLAALQKLKRKYGKSLEEIVSYREEAEAKLLTMQNRDAELDSLRIEIANAEDNVLKLAENLSTIRAAAARKLESGVVKILSSLGMLHARFIVNLPRKALDSGKVVVGLYGIDEPEFLISANKGEPNRSLADVASGGELSRVMLAIKTMLVSTDSVPTMIFDEVDTGIGGEVALSVGEHLNGIAANKQVLCITHLASIAVRADNHYKVEKRVDGERTITQLALLDAPSRIREIARMLSGDAGAPSSIQHAKDLLAKYAGIRGS